MAKDQNVKAESAPRRARHSEGWKSRWIPSMESAQRELSRSRRKRYHQLRRRKFVKLMILAVILGLLATTQFISLVRVSGNSMSPTLNAGSIVACLRTDPPVLTLVGRFAGSEPWYAAVADWWARFTAVAPGELALFDYDSSLLVRRIMATEGQVVDFTDTDMLIGGVRRTHETNSGDRVYPVVVPNHSYFVMGDNRSMAVDSRNRAFGYADTASVRGRALAVVWPVVDIKTLPASFSVAGEA